MRRQAALLLWRGSAISVERQAVVQGLEALSYAGKIEDWSRIGFSKNKILGESVSSSCYLYELCTKYIGVRGFRSTSWAHWSGTAETETSPLSHEDTNRKVSLRVKR